ncbi:MAG: hypothetical protein ACKO1W_14850, partial [Microcystaceae cyanobacterium]
MDKLREILALIHSGQNSFSAEDESYEALKAFQSTARCLIYAENKGLIYGLVPHPNTKNEHHWFDLFLLRGGLTYEGEQFLSGNNAFITDNPIVIEELVMGDSFSNIE